MTATPAMFAVAVAVAWFCLFVVAHIGGWRAGYANAPWLLLTYAASLLGTSIVIGLAAVASQNISGLALALLLALMTSACLFVLYVPAVYTVLTSLSVQTLVMLRRADGRLGEADLYGHFAGRSIVDDRLATLAASGYLVADGGHFRLTSRGRTVARIFQFIKRMWRLGAGG